MPKSGLSGLKKHVSKMTCITSRLKLRTRKTGRKCDYLRDDTV